MDQQKDKLFDEYFSSIFGPSNIFSKKEYENACLHFERNHGEFIPSRNDVKILDIGCGTGHFLYYLEKKGYKNFWGIDISIQQINFCRRNVSKRAEQADAFEFLQNKKNTYDVVVANDLLEHIPKEKMLKFLKLVKEALKKDGIFLLKTPNMGNPFSIFSRYRDFTHEVGFTDKSLYQVLFLAGFRKIRVFPYKRYINHPLKRFIVSRMDRLVCFFITKLLQLQSYVAPRILTPLLFGVAKK